MVYLIGLILLYLKVFSVGGLLITKHIPPPLWSLKNLQALMCSVKHRIFTTVRTREAEDFIRVIRPLSNGDKDFSGIIKQAIEMKVLLGS